MYPEFNPVEQMQRSLENGQGGAFSLNDDPSEDQKLPVRFFWDSRKNEKKSKEEGRLISDRVEMYEIILPTSFGKHDVRRGEVSDKERRRFPKAYEAFQRGADQSAAVGTPLRDWPPITTQPDAIEEANYIGLQTVEHLAALTDGAIGRLGPAWSQMRQKARDWLKKAEGGAVESKLRSENDDLRARMATLEKMLQTQAEQLAGSRIGTPAPAGPDPLVARLAAQVEALTNAIAAKPSDPAPKKRGPKPKNQTPEV